MGNTLIMADDNGDVVVRRDFAMPEPAEGEILIEVLFSGVNPSDMRTVAMLGCRGRVLGNEFCGRVLESPNLAGTPFRAGEIVAGATEGGGNRPLRYGTHQSYICAPVAGVFKVPDNLPFADAAALSIVLQTANDALYNNFSLPLPGTDHSTTEGTLIIWGGSTSVGMAAIQLAQASGVKTIIVTASPERHEYLKTLGATRCINYKEADAVKNIKTTVQGAGPGPLWGFDAAGAPDSQSLLADALSGHENVRLASVLLVTEEGFSASLGARHYDISFDLPNGQSLFIAAEPNRADRMWQALTWVVEHYGAEFQPIPTRIFKGAAEEAIKEIEKVGNMGIFGKLVLEHPLK